MKCKKNKAFAIYNCMLDFNMLSKEVNYKIRPKRERIQLINVSRYKWYAGWFPYKNLKLVGRLGPITFVLI